MKGPYHQKLRSALWKAVKGTEGLSAASLAAALKAKDPTGSGIGRYLRGDKTAGALDLDEAHIALQHCGLVGLPAFVAETPPPPSRIPARVLSFLEENEEFRQLLSALLDARPQRRAEVLEIWQQAWRVLSKKR